jgi:hypothetical protein
MEKGNDGDRMRDRRNSEKIALRLLLVLLDIPSFQYSNIPSIQYSITPMH